MGICLGMQLLLSDGEIWAYLRLVNQGNVKNFSNEKDAKKINIGWKKIKLNRFKNITLYNYLMENNLLESHYYFVIRFMQKM